MKRYEAWVARETQGESSICARERRRGRQFTRWQRDGKSPTARKYARERPVDGKLGKFAKPYAKLLEFDFSSFAKKPRIASGFGKLLEMLCDTPCSLTVMDPSEIKC